MSVRDLCSCEMLGSESHSLITFCIIPLITKQYTHCRPGLFGFFLLFLTLPRLAYLCSALAYPSSGLILRFLLRLSHTHELNISTHHTSHTTITHNNTIQLHRIHNVISQLLLQLISVLPDYCKPLSGLTVSSTKQTIFKYFRMNELVKTNK